MEKLFKFENLYDFGEELMVNFIILSTLIEA